MNVFVLKTETAVGKQYQSEISRSYPNNNCKQGYVSHQFVVGLVLWLDRQSHMTSHQLARNLSVFLG